MQLRHSRTKHRVSKPWLQHISDNARCYIAVLPLYFNLYSCHNAVHQSAVSSANVYMFTVYWHTIRCLCLYNITAICDGYNIWLKHLAGHTIVLCSSWKSSVVCKTAVCNIYNIKYNQNAFVDVTNEQWNTNIWLMMKPCSPTAHGNCIQILSVSTITNAMKRHFIFLPPTHQKHTSTQRAHHKAHSCTNILSTDLRQALCKTCRYVDPQLQNLATLKA